MSNAIIVHGCCGKEEFFGDEYPSLSNSHWIPWLQKDLMKAGIETQTPKMPTPYAPQYGDWVRVFEQFTLTPETIVVGYSCGAGFLLRWLSEHPVLVKKFLLVAPWLDLHKTRGSFLDFHIDSTVQHRIEEIHVLVSADDSKEGIHESVATISATLQQAHLHRFERMGHFTSRDMKTDQFPELLKLIVP